MRIRTASRAAASGDLTLVEVFRDGTNGTNYLDEAAGVTASLDSNFLSFGFAGLPFNATYTDRVINHDVDVQQTHPAKGRLFFDEYFGANSNLGYDERVMLLSPDESQLYTVGYDGDHVGVFRRDVATGIPSHIDTVAWCCGIDPQQGDHTSQSRP